MFFNRAKVGNIAPIVAVMLPEARTLKRWRNI